MSEETIHKRPLGEVAIVAPETNSTDETSSFSSTAAGNVELVEEDGKQKKSVNDLLQEREELYARIKLDESTISELNTNLDSFRNTMATMAEDNAAAHAMIKAQAAKIKDLEAKILLTSGTAALGGGSGKKLLPALSELKSRPSTANIIGRRASMKVEEDFWTSVQRKAMQEIK